jgi:RNA polymerase sigma-70 factor (ECF subfamily)
VSHALRDDPGSDFEATALPFIEDVARFALHLTRDESEAQDVVQETFLHAFRGWHTFRAGSDCRRWLFAICRNAFLRARQAGSRLVTSEEGDLDGLAAVLGHVEATRAGLGDVFDRIDVRPAIDRAVADLPEPHHSILVLVDLEDMTYRQAAEILDVPVGTVRSRLFRARRFVQERLLEHARDMGLGSTSAGGDP